VIASIAPCNDFAVLLLFFSGRARLPVRREFRVFWPIPLLLCARRGRPASLIGAVLA
jgi:hypothetical protein